MVFEAFPSLRWVRPQGRGLEPRACNEIGTRPPARSGNAPGRTAPAQSTPSNPRPSPRTQIAPSAASGLRLRILATGPAPIRLYSDHGRLREPDLKVCPGSSSGIDDIPRRRPGASRTELGRRRSIERQRDPTRRSNAELGDPLSGYRAPQGAALRRRDPRNRIRLPSGEGLQEHHVHERAYLLIAGREINISRDLAA
jgi:hypothetical protein